MASESSSAVPAADFGTRFSAFMIDAAMLFCGQWLVFIVLSRQLQAVGFTSTDACAEDAARLCEGPSTALWAFLLLFLIGSTVAYHAVFEGRYGATPGKHWMGLRVVGDDDTYPIGLGAGLLRSVVRQAFWLSLFFVFDVSPFDLSLPPIIFLGLPVLGLVMVGVGAMRADGQSVHDLVARTRVIRTDEMPASMAIKAAQVTTILDPEDSEESV